MSIVALMAALVLTQGAPQEPQASPAETQEPVALEDVLVEGRRLEELTREFVDEVSAPPRRRGLARWRGGVCVGVMNLRPETAQAFADRVSALAMDHGLRPGDPGCRPNILVVFSGDARAMSAGMVENQRRLFRIGVGGLDRGNLALEAFEATDKPVRWWHVSLPINAETGDPGIRLPGDPAAPFVRGEGLVNKGRWVRDDLRRVVIVVDIDQVSGLMLPQLADYIAMISLAQVDPDADTAGYATILNLFDDPAGYPGLTGWDRAYLRGLYSGPSERIRNSDQSYYLMRSLRRASAAEDDGG
ncbi:hypothetical protein [Brevundimonas sp. Root1423]|uniref:hypothetical protein n=1 Tax=Brevundimonas sp. Root1423 TaxID=1736462 RepID=UPI000700A461|nr:hypothetical protein [Brevundimonas sp. Root1423]KQY91769.1 hypothetical protein ASD25_18860 [Brevundimonas sp. Root1423]